MGFYVPVCHLFVFLISNTDIDMSIFKTYSHIGINRQKHSVSSGRHDILLTLWTWSQTLMGFVVINISCCTLDPSLITIWAVSRPVLFLRDCVFVLKPASTDFLAHLAAARQAVNTTWQYYLPLKRLWQTYLSAVDYLSKPSIHPLLAFVLVSTNS